MKVIELLGVPGSPCTRKMLAQAAKLCLPSLGTTAGPLCQNSRQSCQLQHGINLVQRLR